MSIIIGINAYHGDSSACIVKDGILIAAVEEERFRRVKHWAGFPSKSIEYCLHYANVDISDVDIISINSNPKSNLLSKILFSLTKKPDIKLIIDRLKNARKRNSIVNEINQLFQDNKFSGNIERIDHHRAHLSSAFHVSPFDKSVVVSVDGFGDFSSGSWGLGEDNKISIDNKVLFPHSLGSFYQALTQFIGFPYYGDEYKVMGLAPYGEPKYMDEMRKIVLLKNDGSYRLNLKYFVYHKEKINYEWDGGSPHVGQLFSSELEDLLGPARKKGDELTQRHKDIAHSVQAMFEEAFFHLLNSLHDKYKVKSICIAGGCGMNSVANGKIRRNTPFNNVYIQAASGDAGGAIGAAYTSYFNHNPDKKRVYVMKDAYLGPEYDNCYIKNLLAKEENRIRSSNCLVERIDDKQELVNKTANRITEGKVIGWFQGKLEWGPRALGNRSIICDPRRDDMKDILNSKIKRRESFRPFAPSILRERVLDWFEEDDDVPFMMKVFQIHEHKRLELPAVCHADGSGRLQTVHKDTNELYYDLISAFDKLTGVPILLNTSFNENEPVVCKPEEALECFLRTEMDVLVIGDWFIER